MRVANPYANLHSLLDTTRQLDPEEMAELHLEQGFVDRALAIYDELLAREPENASYQTKRAWLARMLDAEAARAPAPVRVPSVDATIIGGPPPRSPAIVRPLRIVRVR